MSPKLPRVQGVSLAGRTVLFGITLVLTAAAIGLGIWQLRRRELRRENNRQALAARALPPLADTGSARVQLLPNRRVRLGGAFDEAREFLLRGRLVQGVPAVLVITPLRSVGRDTAILVNRGYIPAPDATDPGPVSWSEPGPVVVQGVLLRVPDRGDGQPLLQGQRETWKTLDLTGMRSRLPYPVAALYLIAEPDSASSAHTLRGKVYPLRAEAPPLDEGPHLAYAVQWFMIAAAVFAFYWVFIWRRPNSWSREPDSNGGMGPEDRG